MSGPMSGAGRSARGLMRVYNALTDLVCDRLWWWTPARKFWCWQTGCGWRDPSRIPEEEL
jgi:hypothetical protein